MIKVEDIQQYGKEQFESAVASAATLQNGAQAIAVAVGDYTKKSFEDGNAFVTKLSGVQSLDKVLEVQTEYAKSAYEFSWLNCTRSANSMSISPSRRTSRSKASSPR